VGTTFTIWLPAAGEIPRLLAEPPGELPRGNGETVMIVDDERALVALVEETLAELGYEPVGFDSSVAALQAFHAEPKRFDLVLTDEMMPELTGTELAREIRQVRPDISIILMSGYGGAQLSERAQAAGASRCSANRWSAAISRNRSHVRCTPATSPKFTPRLILSNPVANKII